MHAVDRPGRHRLSMHTLFFWIPHVGGLSGFGIPRWSQIGSLRIFITAPEAIGRGSQP